MGWPPPSPAPQIPAEAPPLRSGEPSSLRMVVDEAKHFPAQSACQRRFAPTAVRLPRNTVRLPAGISVCLHRNPHFSVHRHSFARPALNDGGWMPQEGSNLLPAFESLRIATFYPEGSMRALSRLRTLVQHGRD